MGSTGSHKSALQFKAGSLRAALRRRRAKAKEGKRGRQGRGERGVGIPWKLEEGGVGTGGTGHGTAQRSIGTAQRPHSPRCCTRAALPLRPRRPLKLKEVKMAVRRPC